MKNKKIVRVGLVQTAVSEDTGFNLEKALREIRSAASQGAKIVCLQELFRSPYFCREKKCDASIFAEPIPGETTEAVAAVANELQIVVIAPVYEIDASGDYWNSAAVIDADGAILGVYRKMHIPYDKYFFEKNYFKQGEGGFPVWKTRYADISVLICYDQWFPEAARIATLNGAEIIFYPTAIGNIKGNSSDEGNWQDAWTTVQRGHAIANGVHVCAVNRVGEEGELSFWGGSFACDAFGNVLKKAGAEEDTIIADLDLDMNRRVREGWRFLHNRRPGSYGKLCSTEEPEK